MNKILSAISDYFHGTKHMQGAWPAGTPVDERGNKIADAVVAGDPNFVHAKLSRSEMNESDGRMYDAMGYVVHSVLAGGIVIAILALAVAV